MDRDVSSPAEAAPLEDGAEYASPTKLCDIVMKGGVTSGIVYPLAVCELAKTYTFKNIGGTSAGAIAAAGPALSGRWLRQDRAAAG
jgi:hypothetical protein